MYQPKQNTNTSISNSTLIITAVSCLLGLILFIGTTLLLSSLMKKVDPGSPLQPVLKESGPTMEFTDLPEGYSIALPDGFEQESREETELDYIVYRFRSDGGYKLTLAIIPDESTDRFKQPPRDYSSALVKSVPELSQGIDGDVHAERIVVDGMPTSLFRFYEEETYRGVTFTYFMVTMDSGRKLVLKIAGKFGRFRESGEGLIWPDYWYDSLLTLRHTRPGGTN